MRNLGDLFTVRGAITESALCATRMRAITISSGPLKWKPGQQVHVYVGGRHEPTRTYSIWNHDGSAIELRILEHEGDGPGARWARSVREGDEVRFTNPVGNLVVRAAPYHVFVGEESAQAAFGPMMRALPPDADFYGVVEVNEPGDRLPLPDGLTWCYRYGASAANSASLVEAVRSLELPDEPGVVYTAGEARSVQAVRAHFVQVRKWPRRAVLTKPFWTPGKKGLE
ncbi:MAG: hypothetical protein JWN52_5424 [Actinomycetia bacterium]|nr:hypothetical protein [Actinomycetes bacterium]